VLLLERQERTALIAHGPADLAVAGSATAHTPSLKSPHRDAEEFRRLPFGYSGIWISCDWCRLHVLAFRCFAIDEHKNHDLKSRETSGNSMTCGKLMR
jgi:hypothetical protein